MTTQTGMIRVESSNIHSIGYDAREKQVYVQFLSGGFYRYGPVGPYVFGRFKRAKSKGRFFHQNIRNNPKYKVEKLPAPAWEVAA